MFGAGSIVFSAALPTISTSKSAQFGVGVDALTVDPDLPQLCCRLAARIKDGDLRLNAWRIRMREAREPRTRPPAFGHR